MSIPAAALAYAAAGWFVVPAKDKNPGEYLGKRWQEKSSRDPDKIREWWEKWPDANIAIHLGPSNLVAFDLDINSLDELPATYASISKGKFQRTRSRDSARGHYIFRTRKNETFSNSPGGFGAFGQVRGENGVIIVEPSAHQNGGRYHFPKSGFIPALPDDLRQLLKTAMQHEIPLPAADLQTFLDTDTDNNRPYAMAGVVAWFKDEVKSGASRHDTMVEACCWAFREAFAGCYSAQTAFDALEKLWVKAFDSPGRSAAGREFNEICCFAAAQALVSDVETTLAKLDRDDSNDIEIVRASDIIEKALEPLWPGHLYYGKVSELIGESETGKSLIAECDFCARITTGRLFPGENTSLGSGLGREPQNVIITATEDGFNDVTKPRLIAAGADLDRVFLFPLEKDVKGNVVPLTLPDRAWRLRALIEKIQCEYGPVGYLVISPISAYLAEDIRSHNDASVRRALMPVVTIAEQFHIAVLLVRHPNKDRSLSAIDRGSGSGAFTQLVRASFGVGRHGDGCDTFVFARIANNLAPPEDNPSLTYKIVASVDRPDHPVIEWGDAIDLSANELLGKIDGRKNAPERDEAERFVRELLADGPMRASEVIAQVKTAAGVSEMTVHRAKRKMGVISSRVTDSDGVTKYWEWQLSGKVKVRLEDDE